MIQQHQHLVGGDVVALLVDDAQAIRVTVSGDADVRMVVGDDALQVAQGVRVGGWQMSAEEGIVAVIDDIHIAAGGVEDGHQAGEAHAVHGVQLDAGTAGTDGSHVDLGHDGIQVGIPGVDEGDEPLLAGLVKGDGADLLRGQRVGSLADLVGDLLAGVTSTGGEELDAVVDRRIMAGGDLRAVWQRHVLGGEHQLGRGGRQVDEIQLHALARHDLGEPDGGFPAEEAPVVADTHAGIRNALALHPPCHGTGHPADIAPCEQITNDGAPAASTKFDHRLCLLSAHDHADVMGTAVV